MTAYQVGLSRYARSEKLRGLAWQSGVLGLVGAWGYFSFAPAHLSPLGLSGWASVIAWGTLAVSNAVVTANRALAVTWVDDQGMELRSFFTHRYVAWVHVSQIEVVPRRGMRVLRIYRTIGYPVDVPGAIAPGTGGIADADLDDKAATLRAHWRRVVESTAAAHPEDS